jgi:hypothetical protein
LLGAPTDVLTLEDLERAGQGPRAARRPDAAAAAEETFEAWRARHRALLERAGWAGERPTGDDGGRERDVTRAARQQAAAVELARAALLRVDLGRPADAAAVVAALGVRRGARAEVVREAGRLVDRALGDPVIERARRAAWCARDVPVAVQLAGAVREGRLDLVFEEPQGLVVVRVAPDATAGTSDGFPPETLTPVLGRPVREVLTLDLVSRPRPQTTPAETG